MKIRTMLVIAFLVVGLMPAVTISIMNAEAAREDLQQQISDDLQMLSEAKEGQLFVYLDFLKVRTQDFAADGFLVKTMEEGNTSALNAHLKNMQSLDTAIGGILLMDSDGTVMASTDAGEIGKNEADDDYFQEGMKAIGVTEIRGETHFGLQNTFIASAPVAGHGVIAVVFDAVFMGDILSGTYQMTQGALSGKQGLSKSMEFYLVNSQHIMFIHPAKRNHFEGMRVDTLPVLACLRNGEEVADTYTNYAGTQVIGASMCIPGKGWVLLAEIPVAEAFLPIQAMYVRVWVVLALFTVFILIASLLFGARVIMPIRKLTHLINEISTGNLSVRVDPALKRSSGEFGQLARAFDRTLVSLKLAVKKVGFSKKELKLGELAKEKKIIEERYKTLVQTSPDCIKLLDRNGKILFMNATGLKEHRLADEKQVRGWDWLRSIAEEDRQKAANIVRSVFAGKRANMEIHHTKEGSVREWCAVSFSPVKDENGTIMNVLAVSRDITKEKKIRENMEKKTVQLERFARLAVGREEKMMELKKRLKAGGHGKQ